MTDRPLPDPKETADISEVPADFTEFMASFASSAKQYARSERTYLELLVSERIARVGSGFAVAVIIIMALMIVVLLLTLAAAKAWGAALHNEAAGYLYMGGAYACACVLLWAFSSRLRTVFKLWLINTLHGHE